MAWTRRFVYGVGFYQVGIHLYKAGLTFYNVSDQMSEQIDQYVSRQRSVYDRLRENYNSVGETQWAIVTGASEGIGKGFALDLARAGFNLVLVSRSQEKLDKVAAQAQEINSAIKTDVVALDLGQATTQDYTEKIFKKDFRERNISMVVNNAGMADVIRFFDQPPERIEQHIRLNIIPYVLVTKYAILNSRQFKEDDEKKTALVTVASINTESRIPTVGVYGGTKNFNRTFAESFNKRQATRPVSQSPIDTVILKPGWVTTRMVGYRNNPWETCMPEESSRACLSDLGSQEQTFGPLKHTFWGHTLMPLVFSQPFVLKQIVMKAREKREIEGKKKDE